MPQINILSPHLADLIAAGEVVERPASVIKELMENAFDAGATHVTVEIRNGGATLIRVTDDGCGMAPEDAGIAFLRHATSKLHDESGLEAIRTMGFRGEALAAISSVSRIELITRRPEDDEGTYLTLLAGDIQDMEPTGCPSGTSICVRDLFYNTPARLKFLKSDRSEASACIQAGLRCALGRPEISVRFLRDGKEEFFTPGDGDLAACCYALLGRELSSDLLPVHSEDDGLSLSGFVSSPAAGRGNRGAQYFFVNGRFIRSQILQAALEQAYRNTLLTGRYPACVIWLEIRPGAVDVNVHPAKIEVKFSEERRVFSLLYQATSATLQQEDRIAGSAPTVSEPSEPFPTGDMPSIHSAPEPVPSSQVQNLRPVSCSSSPRPLPSEAPFSAPAYTQDAQQNLFASPVSEYIVSPTKESPRPQPQESRPHPETVPDAPVPEEIPSEPALPVPDHRIIGEAFRTYIIVELRDQIVLIDKHAAHERMNFDRLKQQAQPMAAQELLIPRTLRLSLEDTALVEQYGELFAEFGFVLEPFGENEMILRAAPADIRMEDAIPALEEILQHLKEGGIPDPAFARDEMLHTVACKAAIKAGWITSPQELERLVTEVLTGRIKYCPHGRPVSVTVTHQELDKLFKRIV